MFLVLFSLYLQIAVLSDPKGFTSWLSQFGPFVILVYILIQSLTIIIAPIGGFFIQVAMLTLFPPAFAFTIIYLVVTPLYLVNFLIARKFGRPLVIRLVGRKALEKVDHMAKDMGVSTLLILKLFQGMYFDYISYAVGLTQIPFKTFAIINVLTGIPGILINYYILSRFENLTVGIVVWVVFAYVLLGFSIWLNHLLKKHKKF